MPAESESKACPNCKTRTAVFSKRTRVPGRAIPKLVNVGAPTPEGERCPAWSCHTCGYFEPVPD